MNTQTYTQRAQARPRPRIAVITMGVKLGDETRGYTRFRVLSEMLVEQGFDVDLITSSFQHWEKAQRDTSKTCYQGLPYNVVFIDEPGYTRNLDLQRIHSHRVAAKNLRERFESFDQPTRLEIWRNQFGRDDEAQPAQDDPESPATEPDAASN